MFHRTNEDLAIQKGQKAFEKAETACVKLGNIRQVALCLCIHLYIDRYEDLYINYTLSIYHLSV